MRLRSEHFRLFDLRISCPVRTIRMGIRTRSTLQEIRQRYLLWVHNALGSHRLAEHFHSFMGLIPKSASMRNDMFVSGP
jgi:hypothetical protein